MVSLKFDPILEIGRFIKVLSREIEIGEESRTGEYILNKHCSLYKLIFGIQGLQRGKTSNAYNEMGKFTMLTNFYLSIMIQI